MWRPALQAHERGTMKQKYGKTGILLVCGLVCLWALLYAGGAPDRAVVIDLEGGNEAEELTARAEEIPASDVSDGNGAKEQGTIYVYVCGAVKEPRVAALPEGSRAVDALELAGGFLEDADRDYVNLAAQLSDGERLFFPSKEEAAALTKAQSDMGNGLVNINTADEALLATLPGIGTVRAKAIVEYRKKHGDFKNKESLMEVGGIKRNIYNDLEDLIRVD